MVRRILLFLAALVLALFGTGLVYAYASNADARALANQQPVKVLVAVKTVPAETSAQKAQSDGLVKLQTLPRRAVPPGALTEMSAVTNKVAADDIFPGEVILAAKFIDPTVSGALTIPEGKLAVSVELTDPGRVAGFVVPGSEVAIFDTFELPKSGAGSAQQSTRLLLPRVQVLAAGPTSQHGTASAETSSTADGKPITTSVMTVAVDQHGAEKLVHAAQTGKVSFALLTSQSKTDKSAGVDNSSLFQ